MHGRAAAPVITRRPITTADAATVAQIHATSWRTAYRGILPDAYLDYDVEADRLAHWQHRLAEPGERDVGVLALQDNAAVGFAFAVRDEHERWGSLLDNLHVLPGLRGRGIGRDLLREVATQLLQAGSAAGLHLWVYEDNRDALGFYTRLDAEPVYREAVVTPGGGCTVGVVCWWPSLSDLCEALDVGGRATFPVDL